MSQQKGNSYLLRNRYKGKLFLQLSLPNPSKYIARFESASILSVPLRHLSIVLKIFVTQSHSSVLLCNASVKRDEQLGHPNSYTASPVVQVLFRHHTRPHCQASRNWSIGWVFDMFSYIPTRKQGLQQATFKEWVRWSRKMLCMLFITFPAG